MDAKQRIEELKNLIIEASKLADRPLAYGADFEIIHQPVDHNPVALRKGFAAVYSFFWNGDVLKVGQVGPRSNARFRYQHYQTFRSRKTASTLARSIVDDASMQNLKLDDNTVGDWIKKNCERFDLLINVENKSKKERKVILNFVEGLLQYKLNPKYEG